MASSLKAVISSSASSGGNNSSSSSVSATPIAFAAVAKSNSLPLENGPTSTTGGSSCAPGNSPGGPYSAVAAANTAGGSPGGSATSSGQPYSYSIRQIPNSQSKEFVFEKIFISIALIWILILI